eukprot:3382878-Pyramimonas_sp.AAC.1
MPLPAAIGKAITRQLPLAHLATDGRAARARPPIADEFPVILEPLLACDAHLAVRAPTDGLPANMPRLASETDNGLSAPHM